MGSLSGDAPVKQRRGHVAAHIPPICIAGARPTAPRVNIILQVHAESEGERLLGGTAVQHMLDGALQGATAVSTALGSRQPCRCCPGQWTTGASPMCQGHWCCELRLAQDSRTRKQATGGSQLLCRCRPGQCTAHVLSTVPGAFLHRQWPAQGWGTGAVRCSWPGSGRSGCSL